MKNNITAARDLRQKQTAIARMIPKAKRETRAFVKRLRQHVVYRGEAKTAAFIFGCQRSGTNMLIEALEQSPLTHMYQEDNGAAFIRNRLKSIEVQHQLIQRAPCPVILFKPIADSQRATALLDAHIGSKAIWIFRDVDATSASAAAKWGQMQISLIRQLCDNMLPPTHWLGEHLPDEQRAWACGLYAALPHMTAHEAAAIKWVLRNAIYFDLGLDRQPERVMLVKYEDLARAPRIHFPALFDFLTLPFDAAYVSNVRASAAHHDAPPMDARIRAACDEMMARLERAYRS